MTKWIFSLAVILKTNKTSGPVLHKVEFQLLELFSSQEKIHMEYKIMLILLEVTNIQFIMVYDLNED